jgi:hypothetical protein
MKRKVATAAVVGVLTAGVVMANVQAAPMYLVLTDQRLLFFNVERVTNKAGKLLIALPRAAVTATPSKKAMLGLALRLDLLVSGQEKGLRLTFAPIVRKAGADFATRIPLAA